MDFLEDFFRTFIAIACVLLYVAGGLFLILAPFVFISGAAGVTLGIFAIIFFISLTITIGEHL